MEKAHTALGTAEPHYTYHKGYFLLVLGLLPNGENDGDTENKKQHKKSKAPGFQPRDGTHSVSGQNTQAQNEKSCKMRFCIYRKQSQQRVSPRLCGLTIITLPLVIPASHIKEPAFESWFYS